MNNSKKGIISMLLAALFFAVMVICAKAISNNIPAMQTVFVRSFFCGLVLLPYMLIKKHSVLGKNWKILFLRSLYGCIAFSILFYTITKIHATNASVLNLTSVFFTVIFSAILFKEKLTTNKLVLVLIGFMGVILIIKPTLSFINMPSLLGLLSGFFAGLAYVTISSLKGSEKPTTLVLHFSFYTALFTFLFVSTFKIPTYLDSILLLTVSITGLFGQIFITWAYSYAQASLVAPFLFAQVAIVWLLEVLVLNDSPDILSLVGTLLIIFSGAAIYRLKSQ